MSCKPNSDNSIWTCVLNAASENTETGETENHVFTQSDFTKKGAQRITAMMFLMNFNELTKKAWKMALKFASDKFKKHDGLDKPKLVNQIFQRLSKKKPTKAENSDITWQIYGKESIVTATEDAEMNDSLIWDEIKEKYPFLTFQYLSCPISTLISKLGLNNALKEKGPDMLSWAVERYDDEIKYFRVSLTLPSRDRYIGEVN